MSEARTPPGGDSSLVLDFVDQYLRDRDAGHRLPLAHYLARFPDHADTIAREYLRLQEADVAAPPFAVPSADEAPDLPRVGRYRLIRQLGRGGQGAVYLAEDTRLGRRVALKVLSPHLGFVSDERLQRFRREAELVSRLEHPGICSIHEAGTEAGVPFICMRFVEGETLARVLDVRRAGEGPPHASEEIHRVVRWIERTARALHAAHEAGVIHRDLKPGNLMITPEGDPVLLDFGIARPEASSGDAAPLTMTGLVHGTPAYMSPEQIAGRPEALDRRTDVYSLGVVLYEALTLHKPFTGDTPLELQRRILDGAASPAQQHNPHLPRDLRIVIETALEPDRRRRYPTALELAEDLRRFREFEPVRARPLELRLHLLRWTQRHPVVSSSLALLGIAFLLVSWLGWQSHVDRGRVRAFSDALLAVQRLDQDPIDALEKALAAAESTPREQVDEVLRQILDDCHQEVSVPLHGGPLPVLDPLGRFVIRPLKDGKAGVTDFDTWATPESPRFAATRLAITPDGSRLLTGGKDGALALFEVGPWKETWRWSPDLDIGPITALAFSPDARWAAAGSAQGRLVMVDLSEGDVSLLATRLPPQCGHLVFDPKGVLLLSLAGTSHLQTHRDLRVFEVASGRELAALTLGGGEIETASWHPSSPWITAGTMRGRVLVWDASSGRILWERTAGDYLYWTGFDPRSGALLVPVQSGIEIWDWSENRIVQLLRISHGRITSRAAFSPDGRTLAVLQRDGALCLFETAEGRPAPFRTGTSPTVHAYELHWERTGKRLLTIGDDGANLWRFDRNPVQKLGVSNAPDRIFNVAFHPQEEQVLSGFQDPKGTVLFWDLRTGDAPDRIEHGSHLTRTRFGADGTLALTAGEDGAVRLWDCRTKALRGEFREHLGPVLDAWILESGNRLFTIGKDGQAILCEIPTRKRIRKFSGHEGPIRSAAFHAGRNWVATGGADRTIKVWNLGTGALLKDLPPITDNSSVRFYQPYGLGFDVSRDRFHASYVNSSFATWELDDWRQWSYESGSAFGGPLALDEGNATALLVDFSFGQLTFLDLARPVPYEDASFMRIPRTAGHTSTITRLALSPDRRHALTASWDGRVRVWDVRNRRLVSVIRGDGSGVLDAAWSPDGSRILTGTLAGHLKLWPFDARRAAQEYLEHYRRLSD